MHEQPDVVIVGGSLSGTATALHLARRGHSVVILDRARFPREKTCGEGIMPHGVRELAGLGVLSAIEPLGRRLTGIGYHVGDAAAIGRFPGGSGLGIRRLRLDPAMRAACAGVPGITLVEGVAVEQVSAGPDRCEVRTAHAIYRPRAIVGADGAMSAVRRQLGLNGRSSRPPRYGARLHVELAEGAPIQDVVDVYLHGPYEVYVTPTGDRELNLAILCGKDITTTLGGDLNGGLWRCLTAVPALAGVLDGARVVSDATMYGPLRQVATSVVADRAVLVGDAGGFVDAITGEGMSLALVSARLAADALSQALAADHLSRADLAPYAKARAAYGRDLYLFTELVLWWSHHPRLARYVIGNLAGDPHAFGRLLAIPSKDRGLAGVALRDLRTALCGRRGSGSDP